MKRRAIHLYTGDNGFHMAYVGYGPVTGPLSNDHHYCPTEASARRLARTMQRILNSKQFDGVLLDPNSLTVLL